LNPLISIVIPVFNSGEFLPETLNSVTNQTYSPIEVILVDNGSSETETIRLLNRLKDKYKVLDSGKTGVSNARNLGINESKGEFILPLDSDDLLATNFVALCLEAFNKDDSLSLVRTNIELFGKKKGKMIFAPYNFSTLLARNLMVVSSMFKRSDWNETAGFDPIFKKGFEDWEFWINLLQNGKKVHTIDKCLFKYRIRKGSRNHSLKNEDFQEVRKLIWEKHKKLYSENFVLPTETFEYKLLEDSLALKIGSLILKPFESFKLLN
jgi:glycosyltransferase involved in cell wall biosynthesis